MIWHDMASCSLLVLTSASAQPNFIRIKLGCTEAEVSSEQDVNVSKEQEVSKKQGVSG